MSWRTHIFNFKDPWFKWTSINRSISGDMVILYNILRTDCRLLRYKTGAVFPVHTDVVEGYSHYRFNIVLKRGEGGKFLCENPIWKWWRFNFFRSDLSLHGVDTVTKGPRYVLTFGWGFKQQQGLLQ